MHPCTLRAKNAWKRADRAKKLALKRLQEAQAVFDQAEREEREARADFSSHLELEGSSFDEWERSRDAFQGILSGLPS